MTPLCMLRLTLETQCLHAARHWLCPTDAPLRRRHAQSDALFEEMRAIADRVSPDCIVFVMDATTGQSAGDQARAFKNSVKARPRPCRRALRAPLLSFIASGADRGPHAAAAGWLKTADPRPQPATLTCRWAA